MLKLLFSIVIIIPMLLKAQFSLISPFGGEYLQKNAGTQIKWETSLVDSILHVAGYLIRNSIRRDLNLEEQEGEKLVYVIK